ncbi:hypothetical protein OH77DRAFT_101072 [Trametes cingulata]|nr:hypothetical protein OH77DRAFT_101072 [Trametes cingulata]
MQTLECSEGGEGAWAGRGISNQIVLYLAPVAIRNMFRLRQVSCHVRRRACTAFASGLPQRHRPRSISLPSSLSDSSSFARRVAAAATARLPQEAGAVLVRCMPSPAHSQSAEAHVRISYSVARALHRPLLTEYIREQSYICASAPHRSANGCDLLPPLCMHAARLSSRLCGRRDDGPVSVQMERHPGGRIECPGLLGPHVVIPRLSCTCPLSAVKPIRRCCVPTGGRADLPSLVTAATQHISYVENEYNKQCSIHSR